MRWLPITHTEPEGNGTVLVWCRRTNWVAVKNTEHVRENFDGELYQSENCDFVKFAYIEHPYVVPSFHPWYELILLPRNDIDLVILDRSIGEGAETYEDFCREDRYRYYAGQSDSHLKWLCTNENRVLFKTPEEHLLAEIALAARKA